MLAGLIALASALLFLGSGVADAQTFVSVNAGGDILGVRPKSIHLVSNESLGQLRWSSWGAKSARASGVNYANDPSPGRLGTNPVVVELTARKHCGSLLAYTSVQVIYTRGVPYDGTPRVTTFPFGCPPQQGGCRPFAVRRDYGSGNVVVYQFFAITYTATDCTTVRKVIRDYLYGRGHQLGPTPTYGISVDGWNVVIIAAAADGRRGRASFHATYS
jgi:hypothetical protein